jgi:sec-independent protein translocase protein TatB
MFDIGWTEIALIGGVAVVVLGPEEMPKALYALGKIVRKIRVLTSDIQKSLDKIVNETEVEDLAREVNTKIGGPNLQFEIDRQIAEEERREMEAEEPPDTMAS